MGEPCARLEVVQPDLPGGKGVIYVKSRWFKTKFSLAVSDGMDAWICEASEEEVSRKAFSWDYTVAQYLQEAEDYLAVQKPGSVYSFISQGDETRKLSWTLDKGGGLQLVALWKLEKSPNPKQTTCDILDCLMRGSSRITEELQRKKRSFEQMKAEAQRAEAQSQKFRDQKIQFEEDIYRKFVAVLNSKKGKLRELRELALLAGPSETKEEKNELPEETESKDELDDSEEEEEEVNDSKGKRPIESSTHVTEKVDAEEDNGGRHQADTSSINPDLSHSVVQGATVKQEDVKPERLAAPVTETSTLKQSTDMVIDPGTLLGGPTYTSAPRKRRHR